jgi:hypothetical protein
MVRGLIFAIALVATTSVQARESWYLKGVSDVTYVGSLGTKTDHCDVDMKAWNTSIDFVANQSTKLKLWREADHAAQVRARSDKLKLPENLWFNMTTVDTEIGCVGFIDAELGADLKPSEMISTGTLISNPIVILWTKQRWLSGPFQGFSAGAIQNSEQIMKEFVNDWTASQKLP